MQILDTNMTVEVNTTFFPAKNTHQHVFLCLQIRFAAITDPQEEDKKMMPDSRHVSILQIIIASPRLLPLI